MTVASLLKNKEQNILTVIQSDNLNEVCNLLAKYKIGALIVCGEEKKVEGIISERDIVRAIAKNGTDVLQENVGKYMTPNPVYCSPLETINDIMAKMNKGRFRHMPVIESDKLIGVISIGDIVKARIEAMEQEAQAMQDYIGS